MKYIDIAILFFNLLIFALAAAKVSQMNRIHQSNMSVQQQIEDLIRENNRMADVLFDELDDKLERGKSMIRHLERYLDEAETLRSAPAPAKGTVFRLPVQRNVHHSTVPPQVPISSTTIEETETTLPRNSGASDHSELFHWIEEGLSVLEISQRLNMTQGEVLLKLNLEKKKLDRQSVL